MPAPAPSPTLCLPWPRPRPAAAIVPVFLPFRGCPVRCVFCSQHAQTGIAPGAEVQEQLDAAHAMLVSRRERGQDPAELAFYGGTFTALPAQEMEHCLAFARRMQSLGLASGFRCSTRPDSLDAACLEALRHSGCLMVELGVQSFDDAALAQARRGYDGEQAAHACRLVRGAGLGLGVQLLPGMPGSTPEGFLEDVRRALSLGADALRFYPCLVLEGTVLAGMWREGAYAPWDMATTLDALARGWRLALDAGVSVIRMGLAPEVSLAGQVLAGPAHPALGARVQALALFAAVREALAAHGHTGLESLEVPAFVQGHFWGHGGELRQKWRALGLGAGRLRLGGDEVLRIRPSCRPDR